MRSVILKTKVNVVECGKETPYSFENKNGTINDGIYYKIWIKVPGLFEGMLETTSDFDLKTGLNDYRVRIEAAMKGGFPSLKVRIKKDDQEGLK